MTNADRFIVWNRWYDQLPESWKLHVVVWPLVFIGFVNMQLTIGSGFPFGLLVLLAVLAVGFIRASYVFGWIVPTQSADGHGARLVIGRADWVYNLNTRYDAMPENERFVVIPAILIIAGGLNMWLTLSAGWTFGGLFLLALLVVIAIRAPFKAGLIAPPDVLNGPIAPSWLVEAVEWYDALPRERRLYATLAAFVFLCVINVALAAGDLLAFIILFVIEIALAVTVSSRTMAGVLRPKDQVSGASMVATLASPVPDGPPLPAASPDVAHEPVAHTSDAHPENSQAAEG